MPITRRNLLGRLGAGAAVVVAGPGLAENALASALAPPGRGPGDMLRLNRNENGYGPSPRVIRSLQEAGTVAQRYSEFESEALRRKLASLHGVTTDHIVLGCGSSELLRMAADAFTGPRTKVVTALPTFDVLGRFAERRGAEVVALPLTEQHAHDLERMLGSVDAATRLVYICNPNNPTGTLTRRQDLDTFLHKLPQGTFVVIDEAYHHYVDPSDEYASFIERATDDPRIVVTRSFSKVFGLAGMRVGYAVGAPSTARMLMGCRLPDSVNVLAARAATAAIDDVEHLQTTVERNGNERQEFFNQANARMLRVIDSQANFVMLNTNRPAAEIVEHFNTNRVLIAGPFHGYETYIRVSLGTTAEINEFWRVWDLLPSHHMSMK
jgi:histidinol-phosphate aminotransferase